MVGAERGQIKCWQALAKGIFSAERPLVTVALEEMGPGESATITIRVTALRPARISNLTTATTPGGENTSVAELDIVAPPKEEEEFVPGAGSLILLGGGLLTLAGYARVRWRQR